MFATDTEHDDEGDGVGDPGDAFIPMFIFSRTLVQRCVSAFVLQNN